MSHYVVGDIQGCYSEFRQLLDAIAFEPARDQLWLVGDLVNRGPDSLSVLRTVKSLGAAATIVLGNHDFHLLIVAAGHADAMMFSREVEAVLASSAHDEFLRELYGDQPARWDDGLAGADRLRVIVNACTRLRFCAADGTMEFAEKRGPAHAPRGFAPWFEHPTRKSAGTTIFCGHWSTLDLMIAPNVLMLDSGCVWGGPLTAVRLDDGRVFQMPSRAEIAPKPRE